MACLPSTFAEAVDQVKCLVLQEFDQQIAEKQLYYHNREHIINVQRRAAQIFQVIRPYYDVDNLERMELLLDLCAIAHDMIQIFTPSTQPHTTRRREMGVSEIATIERLTNYIKTLNQHIRQTDPNSAAIFTDAELYIIQEAIMVTMCAFDAIDQGIYQPDLYDPHKNLSWVSRILAIADIGCLGMEGIESYNREGSLLFLEENPDIIPILLEQNLQTLEQDDPELYNNLKQRLLRRSRFQINFAKSRLVRCFQEIQQFPKPTVLILTQDIFKTMNSETIQKIELTTPTHEEITVQELVNFFDFINLLQSL